jgi:hypothetical protein
VATGCERGVIGVSLFARRIEGVHVGFLQGGIATQAFWKIRVCQEGATEGDGVNLALGDCGLSFITAEDGAADEYAVE